MFYFQFCPCALSPNVPVAESSDAVVELLENKQQRRAAAFGILEFYFFLPPVFFVIGVKQIVEGYVNIQHKCPMAYLRDPVFPGLFYKDLWHSISHWFIDLLSHPVLEIFSVRPHSQTIRGSVINGAYPV